MVKAQKDNGFILTKFRKDKPVSTIKIMATAEQSNWWRVAQAVLDDDPVWRLEDAPTFSTVKRNITVYDTNDKTFKKLVKLLETFVDHNDVLDSLDEILGSGELFVPVESTEK